MQPGVNIERCPRCGKAKSVTMINISWNAAAPAVPTVYHTTTSYEMCNCPLVGNVGFIGKRG